MIVENKLRDGASIVTALFVGATLACSRAAPADAKKSQGLEKLGHIVVIYMENHSFDNLYGEFPGANGLSRAGDHARQVDRSGKPYGVLPQPPGHAFPGNLPNAPFDIERYIPIGANTPDLVHRC